jgi:hypothetical protein
MNVDEIIEAAMGDYFWAPDSVTVVDRPEIKYTHSDRPDIYFNSVVRVRPQLADPAGLVDEVAAVHRDRQSRWSLNPMSDTPALRQALQAGGYTAGQHHHAYVIAPDEYARTPPDDVEVRRVTSADDLRTLYEIRADVFGLDSSEDDIARELALCTGPNARVARFVAYRDGEPAGTGGLTFFDSLSFGFTWSGGVRQAHRGHGVYTSLLRTRLGAAAARGIRLVGLYARDDTSGPIVAAHGFERHGPMTYWDRI